MSTSTSFFVPDKQARKRIAIGLRISYEAVRKWPKIPAERVLEVCAIEDWRLTPHLVRPDLYPNPDDAIPEHLRNVDAPSHPQILPPSPANSSFDSEAKK